MIDQPWLLTDPWYIRMKHRISKWFEPEPLEYYYTMRCYEYGILVLEARGKVRIPFPKSKEEGRKINGNLLDSYRKVQ